MSLRKGRFLIVLLVLLGFVSQVVASAVMSPKMSSIHQSMPTMNMMDHSSHAMDLVSMAASDCCQQDCYCPMAGCVAAMLPTLTSYDVVISPFQISLQPLSLVVSQSLSSLYRPPITA